MFVLQVRAHPDVPSLPPQLPDARQHRHSRRTSPPLPFSLGLRCRGVGEQRSRGGCLVGHRGNTAPEPHPTPHSTTAGTKPPIRLTPPHYPHHQAQDSDRKILVALILRNLTGGMHILKSRGTRCLCLKPAPLMQDVYGQYRNPFIGNRPRPTSTPSRDWYVIVEQPAPAPHLAHPEGCAALRIVLVTVPRVSRSCVHFPDGFDLHLLHHLAPTPETPCTPTTYPAHAWRLCVCALYHTHTASQCYLTIGTH